MRLAPALFRVLCGSTGSARFEDHFSCLGALRGEALEPVVLIPELRLGAVPLPEVVEVVSSRRPNGAAAASSSCTPRPWLRSSSGCGSGGWWPDRSSGSPKEYIWSESAPAKPQCPPIRHPPAGVCCASLGRFFHRQRRRPGAPASLNLAKDPGDAGSGRASRKRAGDRYGPLS